MLLFLALSSRSLFCELANMLGAAHGRHILCRSQSLPYVNGLRILWHNKFSMSFTELYPAAKMPLISVQAASQTFHLAGDSLLHFSSNIAECLTLFDSFALVSLLLAASDTEPKLDHAPLIVH